MSLYGSIESVSPRQRMDIKAGKGYMNTILSRKLVEKSPYNTNKRSLNFHRKNILTISSPPPSPWSQAQQEIQERSFRNAQRSLVINDSQMWSSPQHKTSLYSDQNASNDSPSPTLRQEANTLNDSLIS
jgi:hypothetical protein